MDPILETLLLLLLPLCYIVVALQFRDRKRRILNHTKPVHTSLLRAPGETLGQRLQGFFDRQIFLLFICLIGPVLAAVVAYRVAPTLLGDDGPSLASGLLALGTLVGGGILGLYGLREIYARADHLRLRYLGERWIGEHLDRLQRRGYRIFHDVPVGEDADAAVNHLALGINGLFCIETVMHLLPGRGEGEPTATYEAGVFDFAGRKLPEPARRVRAKADHLAEQIRKETGLEVPVRCFLVAPGWKIEARGGGGETPEALAVADLPDAILRDGAASLDDASEAQVGRVLDKLCRDVAL